MERTGYSKDPTERKMDAVENLPHRAALPETAIDDHVLSHHENDLILPLDAHSRLSLSMNCSRVEVLRERERMLENIS